MPKKALRLIEKFASLKKDISPGTPLQMGTGDVILLLYKAIVDQNPDWSSNEDKADLKEQLSQIEKDYHLGNFTAALDQIGTISESDELSNFLPEEFAANLARSRKIIQDNPMRNYSTRYYDTMHSYKTLMPLSDSDHEALIALKDHLKTQHNIALPAPSKANPEQFFIALSKVIVPQDVYVFSDTEFKPDELDLAADAGDVNDPSIRNILESIQSGKEVIIHSQDKVYGYSGGAFVAEGDASDFPAVNLMGDGDPKMVDNFGEISAVVKFAKNAEILHKNENSYIGVELLNMKKNLTANSVYKTKDRKARHDVVTSLSPGTMRQIQPVGSDLLLEQPKKHVGDKDTIDMDKIDGFSKTHATIPFANSISGHTYVWGALLMKILTEDQGMTEHADTLSRLLEAFTCANGYHSRGEIRKVFDELSDKGLLAVVASTNPDDLKLSGDEQDTIHDAMNSTAKYAEDYFSHVIVQKQFHETHAPIPAVACNSTQNAVNKMKQHAETATQAQSHHHYLDDDEENIDIAAQHDEDTAETTTATEENTGGTKHKF